MKIFDILGMGLRNLLRRKTRTSLTITGVVVGAVAIVIMLSLGIGMTENLNKSIERMGDLTVIDLQQWPYRPPSDDNEYVQAENTLDDELLEKKKIVGRSLSRNAVFGNVEPEFEYDHACGKIPNGQHLEYNGDRFVFPAVSRDKRA